MKQIIQSISTRCSMLCAVLLLAASCEKENALEPSNQDENYFVIKDNLTDPVDHAIFQFYQSTGVASFYNDTAYKRRIADSAGLPRYTYITLSLNYELLGNNKYRSTALSSTAPIPALLDVLKTQMLPRIPGDMRLPSILFVDSVWMQQYPIINKEAVDGWTSYHGFNTVAIQVKDVAVMSNEEQKVYMASILAGIAERRINNNYAGELQKKFYSISRSITTSMMPQLPVDIYYGLPFAFFMDPSTVPEPEQLGFLRYIDNNIFGIMDPLYLKSSLLEIDDLRAYLTAVFTYSTAAFNTKYVNDELVLQKYAIIRKMAEQVGFQFTD